MRRRRNEKNRAGAERESARRRIRRRFHGQRKPAGTSRSAAAAWSVTVKKQIPRGSKPPRNDKSGHEAGEVENRASSLLLGKAAGNKGRLFYARLAAAGQHSPPQPG